VREAGARDLRGMRPPGNAAGLNIWPVIQKNAPGLKYWPEDGKKIDHPPENRGAPAGISCGGRFFGIRRPDIL
jgi:hypothetical protein